MTVLLGVSMGTRAVRTAQPRAEQFGGPVADDSGLVTDIERPLFFRNELIDSVGGDLPHLAAESIHAAVETEPELATGVAYRDPRQADALHEALAGAHLHNYHLVHEVEAVVEYLAATGEARDYRSVALFDLGSSGLTVSVVDLVQRTVVASQRSGEYSGDLLDAYVRNNQLERLGKKTTDSDIALFEKRCRIAKERLSTQDAVCLPDASGMILLSRENFEMLITELLDEAIEFARGVLIGANVPIDAVVLIGGGARMPIVQKRVGPLLELPSIVPTEPETVAARGAALAARPHSRARTAPRRTSDAHRLGGGQPNSPRIDPAAHMDAATASAPAPQRRPAPPRLPQSRVANPRPPKPPQPPVPTAAPVRPTPARTESLHSAPSVSAPVPSVTRPVPARPWVASAPAVAEVADTATADPAFADAATADPAFADAATADPAFADTATADPAFADTATADPAFADAATADTALVDTTTADTAVADTTTAGTATDGTAFADTSSADTSTADTALLGTATADAAVDTPPAAGGFESSKFADTAVDSSSSVATQPESSSVVADDVRDDHVQAERVDDKFGALSTHAGEGSADASGVAETLVVHSVTQAPEERVDAENAADDYADGKPVPFQLKNIYWLDADYDDDDGEDDRTRARRKLRTGGVLALCLAAVVGVSGFMLTHQNTPQVVDTSVSRTQTQAPAATTVAPTSVIPAPVLPPPAPETTVEPTPEPTETEVYQEPWTPEPTTTTAEPAPLPPVESVPPTTTQQPPPLIPGFPDFTLPGFPPIAPPAP